MRDLSPKQPIRVLIVDDHLVLAELLTTALSVSDDVTVVGAVGTAAELFLSVNTVRNHMQHVLNKLGALSKLEATAIAAQA